MGQDVWEWLEKACGLDPASAQDFGARAVRHPQHGDGIALPFRTLGGETAGEIFAGSNGSRAWGRQGAPRLVLGLDDIQREALSGQPVVITFDPLDHLAVLEAGSLRACAVCCLSEEDEDAANAAMIACLRTWRDAPSIIIAPPITEAGVTAARTIAAALDPHPVRIALLPDGASSPLHALSGWGVGSLAAAINGAPLIDPPGGQVTGFSDLPPLAPRRILRTGIDLVDRVVAFEKQAMSVCTGVPGFGKSTFVRWCAHHLVRNEGVRIGAIELEGNPRKMQDHLARLRTGRPYADLDRMARARLNAELDDAWRIVHRPKGADSAEENLEWLRSRIQHLATRERCSFVYVDPWNELEHDLAPGETLTNYINHATRCIRQWAERYDVHLCVIAHPKKLSDDRMPNGYDVADSAAWANKPALGFTVHQADEDGYGEHVQVQAWKVRDAEAYQISRGNMARFVFNPVLMDYEPAQRSAYA